MSYSAARLAADSLRVLPRKQISRMLGRFADFGAPPAVVERAVKTFVRVYDVDMAEAVVPPGGFRSFNEFFTRRLVDGARPIDPDLDTVVSPADGRIDDMGPISEAAELLIKGRRYTVGELLGDAAAARRYEGGTYFIVYLSPRDYHRVHAAFGGPVSHVRHVPGTLFPVNDIGVEHVPGLFARNERVSVVQRTERFGEVTTIMVGAIGVGRIGLSFDDVETNIGRPGGLRTYGSASPTLDRGEELGVFNLGSTVIAFIGPEAAVEWSVEPSQMVRVGEALARISPDVTRGAA